MVWATGAGVTASRAGNVITFSLPGGGVRIMSATIRIKGANLVAGAAVIDSGRGGGATGWKDRWNPNIHAWREDTGNSLAITTTSDLANFAKIQINNMNSSTTNYIKLAF
jgi:hypothetical protein